jgi:hypothetical protein
MVQRCRARNVTPRRRHGRKTATVAPWAVTSRAICLESLMDVHAVRSEEEISRLISGRIPCRCWSRNVARNARGV